MGDDVKWEASSPERMAEIDRKSALAQRYLDETGPRHDPIFNLPLAEERYVHARPELQPVGERACGARAREKYIHQGPYQTDIALRYEVRCKLLPGHDGPHIAESRREWTRTWCVLAWDC